MKENILEKNTVPENGDVYEAFEDFQLNYRTIHVTSASDSGQASFPSGERLVVDTCGSKRLNVYCDAVNYNLLEEHIVPECVRSSRTYKGYYFHVAIPLLKKHCRKIT